MTKIQVISDLHLEFDSFFKPSQSGSDILILSGDICVAEYFNRNYPSKYFEIALKFKEFFRYCSQNWSSVVYVMGNHEHYHGTYNNTYDILKETISSFKNIYLLENESISIEDILFYGCTLWTDCDKFNPMAQMEIRYSMNDYRLIKNVSHRASYPISLIPDDTCNIFVNSVTKMKEFLELNKETPCVIVTHHSPSFNSVSPIYHSAGYMNNGYYSDLEYLIEQNPQIRLWTHGHMHNTSDYMIGSTRVYCNPRGYNNENPNFRTEVIEVE